MLDMPPLRLLCFFVYSTMLFFWSFLFFTCAPPLLPPPPPKFEPKLNSSDALTCGMVVPYRHFDDDEAFLAVWDEVREVAVSPPAQRVPTTTETKPESGDAISSMHSENPTLPPLARHLGIGGHGPLVAERLAFLFKSQQGQKNVEIEIEKSDMPAAVAGTIPDIIPGGIAIPSLFFGDLGAGDGAATAETIDMCRNRGVQAFSIRYAGGEGAEEAGKGAAAAADWEHEDVRGCFESIAVVLLYMAIGLVI